MKTIGRIVEVVRVDRSPGFVAQITPRFWLARWVGWQDVNGLQYATLEEADRALQDALRFMNGAQGKVVRRC